MRLCSEQITINKKKGGLLRWVPVWINGFSSVQVEIVGMCFDGQALFGLLFVHCSSLHTMVLTSQSQKDANKRDHCKHGVIGKVFGQIGA